MTSRSVGLEETLSSIQKVRIRTVWNGQATANSIDGMIEFDIEGAAELQKGQLVCVFPVGVSDVGSEKVIKAKYSDSFQSMAGLSQTVQSFRDRYSSLLLFLHKNDSPYNALLDLKEELLDGMSLLGMYDRGRTLLPEECWSVIDKIKHDFQSLMTDIDYAVSCVDEVQLSIDQLDRGIFHIDLEAEVIKSNLPDGGYEIMAQIGDFVALMASSKENSGSRKYEFPNCLLGERNVRLTHVDGKGFFYCEESDPTNNDIIKYFDNLRGRLNHCEDLGGRFELFSEINSLGRYIRRKSQQYEGRLVSGILDFSDSVEDESAILYAERNGKLVVPNAENLFLLGIESGDELGKRVLADSKGYRLFTYHSGVEKGAQEKALLLLLVRKETLNGLEGNFITPYYVPGHHQKQALTALASKLYGNGVNGDTIFYLKSTKKLARIEGVTHECNVRDPELGKIHVYRINSLH